MIDLNQINYVHYNERDIEVPILLNTVYEWLGNKYLNVNSLLDVGANYSYFTYAPALRLLLDNKTYHGVDPFYCEKTEKIVDAFFSSDVLDIKNKYDALLCISTLEHVGMYKPMQANHAEMQLKIFKHCIDLANKFFLFTFPFGKEGFYPDQYSNITEKQTQEMIRYCGQNSFSIEKCFFYNEFPQGKNLWNKIHEVEAIEVPLNPSKGTQCICVMEGHKIL